MGQIYAIEQNQHTQNMSVNTCMYDVIALSTDQMQSNYTELRGEIGEMLLNMN